MYWFTLTSLLHKNIAQRRFVKCFCSGKCKIGGLNTDLGTLGARYLLHLVDEWNSGRKLSFAYTFSAIVMVSGDDAGSHGVFFIQGYGTGRDRIININTVNIGVNLECRLTAEMDVYIRNATVPVGISAFMLLGKLPIVSK